MIELRLLGTLELRTPDGRDLTALARRSKRTALLLYLAAATPHRLHRRDTLLAIFWPELDDAKGRSALSQALYVLRNALGEHAIVTRGDDEVGIAHQLVWCDTQAFETALDAGRYAEALALYRGGLLHGFSLADAPEFGRWVDQERARLQERAAEGAWALAETRSAAGDTPEAVHWARRAADLSPVEEVSVRRLMTFLERQGDRVAALRVYESFAATLKADYELAPSVETQTLAERLRQEQTLAPRRVQQPESTIATQPRQERSAPGVRRLALLAVAALGAIFGIRAVLRMRVDPAASAIRRLAVLPLENFSGDTSQQYLVDGIHDALITELAKLSGLSVTSRSSVIGYRHTTKAVPEIARELHVDAVVEGSVLPAGDSVRVTAQLIAGPTDRHLWAETYIRSRRDMLMLFPQVTHAIAEEIRLALTPLERARLARTRTVDPEVYTLYLRGRSNCESWADGGFQRGIAFYRRAIDQDETFALPYEGLAACYADWAFSLNQQELFPLAKAAATRALELDSTLGLPHATLAWLRLVVDHDYYGPDGEFRKAVTLSPGSGWILAWYGNYLNLVGRFDEGLPLEREAVQLDPLSFAASWTLAWDLHFARRYDESTLELQRALGLDPGNFNIHLVMAANYAMQGNPAAAVAQCDTAIAMAPLRDDAVESCGWVWARAGQRKQAAEALRVLTSTSRHRPTDPVEIAKVYQSLGDPDRALGWLRRAVQERYPPVVYLKTDPVLDPLRSDPRFQALLRELKMAP